MTAGYSGKPLVAKLGYKPGDKVYTLDAPDDFAAHLIENGIVLVSALPAEWVHMFVKSQAELKKLLQTLTLEQIGKGLWVSWPKKASKVKTDLTEQTFRDLILPLGWVDTKVVAVDETWSGLKFYPRKG
jgi:hypothetical protein